MTSENIITNKPTVTNLLKKTLNLYLENLKKKKEPDYLGSFFVFEEDEELFKALFKSPYINKHLDYEHLLSLLHIIVQEEQNYDPKSIVDELEKMIAVNKDHLYWLALYPIKFNSMVGRIGKEIIEDSHDYGEFLLTKKCIDKESLKNIISKYAISEIDEESYCHQVTQGNKALTRNPLLIFELHGSNSLINYDSKYYYTFYCWLMDVFSVIGESRGGVRPSNDVEVKHSFFLNKKTGQIQRIAHIKPLHLNININNDFFEFLNINDFPNYLNLIYSEDNTLFNRIRSSLYFFSKAINGDDSVSNFVSYVISIEALFSKDKNNPIKITLAEYIALLCYPPEERLGAFKAVQEIYDERSRIVHSGQFSIKSEQVKNVQNIAAKTIHHCLKLYLIILNENKSMTNKNDLDNIFFQKLREMRLGINPLSFTIQPIKDKQLAYDAIESSEK